MGMEGEIRRHAGGFAQLVEVDHNAEGAEGTVVGVDHAAYGDEIVVFFDDEDVKGKLVVFGGRTGETHALAPVGGVLAGVFAVEGVLAAVKVAEGDAHVLDQAVKQTRKLQEVKSITILPRNESLLCETIPVAGRNTTIGVIATDTVLTKAQAQRLATCAHDGLARTIRPVHTQMDGDTLFALATGQVQAECNPIQLCAAGAEVMARAVMNAVTAEADE